MEHGKDGHRAASRPNGHASSHQLVVNYEKRKPLFANTSNAAAARTPGPQGPSLEVRSTTNPVETGARTGPNGLRAPSFTRRARSDPQGASSEMGDNRAGVPATKKTVFRSPAHSRIPGSATGGFQSRRPLSLTEAFRLAQEEEEEAERQRQLGGSPSPAPRLWRARPGQPQDEMQARQMLGKDQLDGKGGRNPLNTANGQNGGVASADYGTLEADATAGPSKRLGTGPSLQERINDWRTKSRPVPPNPARTAASPEDMAELGEEDRLPALVPGIEDPPFPSAESRQAKSNPSSPSRDFTWQVDHDFTAGDLQVSDSPRIRVGANSNKPFANRPSIFKDVTIRPPARVKSPERSNTRLDDIQADEVKHGVDNTAGNAGLKNLTKLRQQRQNIRVDEMRATEEALDKKMQMPDRSQPRQKNEKLDSIRQLETAGLSKRALAAMRLAEIKEQNAMARTRSSETAKPQPGGGTDGCGDGTPARPRSAFEFEAGRHVPDTPVTIYKQHSGKKENIKPGPGQARWPSGPTADTAVKQDGTHEQELLRRLARAAGASPAPEQAGRATSKRNMQPEPSSKSTARPSLGGRFIDPGRKSAPTSANANHKHNSNSALNSRLNPRLNSSTIHNNHTNNNNNNNNNSSKVRTKDSQLGKPTVGFSGLRRANSAESVKSKPSSMHSESDPTDRIEAEMKLFAPADNYSERGSVRAPSMASDSSDEEEAEQQGRENDDDDLTGATPNHQQHDVPGMPTPKVTGAYVETPVTVKPIKSRGEDQEERAIKPFTQKLKEQQERDDDGKKNQTHAVSHGASPNLFRDKKAKLVRRKIDNDTASDPGTSHSDQGEDASTTASMAAAAAEKKKPRSRSWPRKRQPLKNSAQPPSVKDDLRELQRQHNMEDSTVDDLEEILTGRKVASPKLKELLEQLPSRENDEIDRHLRLVDDEMKRESEVHDDAREGEDEKEEEEEISEGQSALVEKMGRAVRSGLSNIREAKMGIERLEGQIAPMGTTKSSEKQKRADATPQEGGVKTEHEDEDKSLACITDSESAEVTYLYIPLTRTKLCHIAPPSQSRFIRYRPTIVGAVILTLLTCIAWYAAENLFCGMYCRPTTCNATPCVYSYDDPTFGNAIPVKLDEWTTGGRGGKVLRWAYENAHDWVTDQYDAWMDVSIEDVPVRGLSAAKRRQHWRRLLKRGLLKGVGPGGGPAGGGNTSAEQRAKWEGWRRARLAKERAREVRDLGYGDGGGGGYEGVGDSMAGDERVL